MSNSDTGLILRGWLVRGQQPPHVVTGLVPVIPIKKSAASHRIGVAGTSPAMTWEGVRRRIDPKP
jgi:hypothetical protein